MRELHLIYSPRPEVVIPEAFLTDLEGLGPRYIGNNAQNVMLVIWTAEDTETLEEVTQSVVPKFLQLAYAEHKLPAALIELWPHDH